MSVFVRQQREGPDGKVLINVGDIVEKLETWWWMVESSSWAVQAIVSLQQKCIWGPAYSW